MRRMSPVAALLLALACSSPVTDSTVTPPLMTPTTSSPTPAAETGTTSGAAVPTSRPGTTLPPLQGLALEVVAERLTAPLFVTSPPGDERLFIAEQSGGIRIVAEGALLEDPFLDLSDRVLFRGERGLLGLAFHPLYSENGRLFVHYSDSGGDTALVEYRVSEVPNRADPGSARRLLDLRQPAPNHNGGMLTFGPDGYLYLALGDGGGGGDRFGNGQDPSTLLGSILRLDVDSGDPYGIPPDNPFVSGGGAPEVWAYGLRNPWRFAFGEDLLYVADVGQNAWEEVDVVPADAGGLNYGWPIMEGTHCYPPGAGCDAEGLVMPVIEYGRDQGCTVIGGFEYLGAALPELSGHYFYGDLCGGWIRSFRFADGEVTDLRDWTEDLGVLGRILSFGTDARGELYVTLADGRVLRLVPIR